MVARWHVHLASPGALAGLEDHAAKPCHDQDYPLDPDPRCRVESGSLGGGKDDTNERHLL